MAILKSDQLLQLIVNANMAQVGILSTLVVVSSFTNAVIPGLCEKMAMVLKWSLILQKPTSNPQKISFSFQNCTMHRQLYFMRLLIK